MWVLREWKEADGEHFIKVQLFTACCKEKIDIRIDGENNYFWLARLEKCSPTITYDISCALREWRKKGNVEP